MMRPHFYQIDCFYHCNERNFSILIEKMVNDHDFVVTAEITFTSYKTVTSSNRS